MTTRNDDLYSVLRALGADEAQARAATDNMLDPEAVATKADLQIELQKTKNEILKWMMTGFLAQTAVLLTIVGIVT